MTKFFPLNKKEFELPKQSELHVTGFASPADDYVDIGLKLGDRLIQHEQSTFYGEVTDDSMIGAGIFPKDTIIIDKALDYHDNSVIVAILNNEFLIRFISKFRGQPALFPANKNYKPIVITDDTDFQVWGVVTYSLHHL